MDSTSQPMPSQSPGSDNIEPLSVPANAPIVNNILEANRHAPSAVTPVSGFSRSLFRAIKECMRRIVYSVINPPAATPYSEEWVRTIEVELQLPGFPRRIGVASIDTRCHHDLMSRDFASLIGLVINTDTALKEPMMKTVKGETIHVLGRIGVRWHIKENDIPPEHRIMVDPKFQSGTLYITDSANDFDVIIGNATIIKHSLLGSSRKLIGPSFRSTHPEYNESTVAAEQEAADKKRALELEAMKQYEQQTKEKK